MTVTRSDVARSAGVSPAVVSYVINNGPRKVAPSTRLRVEAAILELGYRPNAIASALRGGATQSIGYLAPDPQNSFYAQLGEALERSFSAHGYFVLTGNTYYDRAREERYLRKFLDRRVDGLIFSSGVSISSSSLVTDADVPELFLQEARLPGQSSISTDDVADAATAVEHLQRHGHELIGCVAGPAQNAADDARIRGWRRQQQALRLPSGNELVAYAETSEEGGNIAALLLLGAHGRPWTMHGRRPSALFVASDIQAVGAVFACHELRLRVPDDLAIVSLGGTKAAAYTVPPLTTMRQDVEYIATTATAHLLGIIRDDDQKALQLALRGNLVIGHSCGC